jgi:hypothetical protein
MCKMVRPGSGYKIFNNSETQNYAIKDDHLIVYDDFQSLKEKVRHFQILFSMCDKLVDS